MSISKRERLIIDLDFEKNDASASIFGWEFQILSAIPIVLYDIKNVNYFVIEGKYQDIEIYYCDQSQCFIQSKAIQMKDSEDNSTKNQKFKQAIASLYKSPFIDSEKIIYCSNFKSPILEDSALFSNKLVGYSNCPPSIQNNINGLIVDVAVSIENELNNKKAELAKKGETINKRIESRMLKLSRRLKDASLRDNIYFYTVYPFFGNGSLNERASAIDDKIIAFLSSVIQFEPKKAVAISTRLLKHWATYFLNNAGTVNELETKIITKQDFLWPIVVFNSFFDTDFVKETMQGRITASDINDATSCLNDEVFLQLQRFKFLHKLYRDFTNYRKSPTSSNPERDFINEKWHCYKDEFGDYAKNEV